MKKPFFIPEDFANYLWVGMDRLDWRERACDAANIKVEILLKQIQELEEQNRNLKAFISEMNEPFDWDG